MGKGGGEKGGGKEGKSAGKGSDKGEKGKGKPTGKGGKGKKGDGDYAKTEWDDSWTDEGAPSTADSNPKGGKADGKGKSGKGKDGKGKKGKGPGKGLPDPEELGKLVDDAMKPDEIFEDALREALQERRRLDYPEMPVQEVFDVVHPSVQPHYHNLVYGISGRISDFEGKCGMAEKRHRAWIKERHRLGEEVEVLQRKFNEERARAAQNSAVAANNSLRLLTGQSIPKGHLNAIKVVGAGGLDVNIQHLEKDIGKLDIDLGTTRFKALQAMINTIYWRVLPQTRATKYIASQYGEACGAFFRFHSTLLLISVITLACYAPLLVMQVMDQYDQLGQNWCGSSAYIKVPCEFLFGGFRGVNVTMAENWTTAVQISINGNGEPEVVADVGADAFNSEMGRCPVLRHVRDCRVHSLYAGYMTNSSAAKPYELFTSSWSSSPYQMNKDYVVMSNYADLLNSASTWACGAPTVDGVGFPADCGMTFGSFGDAPAAWKDWFALPPNSSQAVQEISFGSSLEVFSGARCPVQEQEDIEDLAARRKRPQEPSGRDVWLAVRYFCCTFGGALFVAIFVIIRWKSAEVTFSIEHSVEEVSPIRWSRWVLGLRDFRLRTREEKELWGQALANLLRAEYEAETHAEREGAKQGWQRWMVTFKRFIGATLNITVIFGSWVAIAYSFVEQPAIQAYLENVTTQDSVRSVLTTVGAFAPNLVIAAAGQVLPFITKTLTEFEAWDPAARARHNLWRLFFGKVLNATVFIALNVELLNDKPMLLKSRFLATRDCLNFVCAEDQAGMQVVSLTNSELAFSSLKPFTKLVRAAVLHFTGVKRLCKKRADDDGRRKPPFPWPMFDIAEVAVDTVYLQLLIWTTQLFMPFVVVLTPVVLWLHFRWLSFQLRHLTSRPFVSDSSRLRVALQRVLCCGAMLYCTGVLFFLMTSFPHEPGCGPFDSHQTPGNMIFDLEFGFRTQLVDIMSFVIRIWLIILLVLIFMVFMLWLRMMVARRTNVKVLDTLAATSQRQVENLYKEMMRLEQKADNYRKRIEWIEKHHKNK